MTAWNYIEIILSLLLLGFLTWQEVVRANKLRLVWRIVASVFSVVSLLCIALPIVFNIEKNVSSTKESVLLTDGFSADNLTSFMGRTINQFQVFSQNQDIVKSSRSYNARLISSVEFLNNDSDKIAALHVFGYGLNNNELQQLKNVPVVFHSTEVPTGITSISWNHTLFSGEKLRVQGKYNNTLSNEIKIVLRGLSTHLDSIFIPAKTNRIFELAAIPKNIGRAVFELSVVDGKQTAETEDIPVEIVQPQVFKILMLSASPNFENKFLKDWLSANNYSVAYRSRISKDKFQREFVNTTEVSLDKVSAQLLDKFDVLIADANELDSISKAEVEIIRSQVENKGLGLIIRADSSIKSSSFYAGYFPLSHGKENAVQTISLHLKDSSASHLKIAVERPVFILPHAATQPLAKDEKSAVFVNSTRYGMGKIVMTTLSNSYTLQLAGDFKNYSAFWSLLLTSAARKNLVENYFGVAPALPFIQNPVAISSVNSSSTMAPAIIGEDHVYLQQNNIFPKEKSGIYWPAQTGWLPQIDEKGRLSYFYVYSTDQWKAVKALKSMNDTKEYVHNNSPKQIIKNNMYTNIPFSIPKVYFFIIFVASVALLWFERKFS